MPCDLGDPPTPIGGVRPYNREVHKENNTKHCWACSHKKGTKNSWECSHKYWLDMRKSKWDYLYDNGPWEYNGASLWLNGVFAYCTANIHLFAQDIMNYAR